VVLVIAGSDPLGYSGLQADLRHLAALGCQAAGIPTCLTEQSLDACLEILPVEAGHVARTIGLAVDGGVAAVKIGLLHRPEVVSAVAVALGATGLPMVLDPVLAAGGGASLVEDGTRQAILDLLIPLAALVTPNVLELASLTDAAPARSLDERAAQARLLIARGTEFVLVKGGHDPDPASEMCDLLVSADSVQPFVGSRYCGEVPRGTGCALSTLIAREIAEGQMVARSVETARERLDLAIRAAMDSGSRRIVIKR